MTEILGEILQVGFFAAILRIATPLILATIGEMFTERGGVLNLGIEGIMLLGSMAGFSAAYFSGSLWLGILAAMAVGALAALLMGFLTVTLGLSQHVSGIGTTLLCTGLAFFLYRLIFGQPSVPPNVEAFQAVVLYHTPWGLSLRAVGENPRAADGAGVSVAKMRYQALVLSGMLMGAAGAYLSMAQFNAFTFGVISGRGWVCIALVVFGQWSPWKCLAGALLFGFVDALQLRLQASGVIDIPYQFFLMLPFVLTIVAMGAVSRSATPPAALLVPFRKEER